MSKTNIQKKHFTKPHDPAVPIEKFKARQVPKDWKNNGQMKNAWVFQGHDEHPNKTSYQLAYAEKLPELLKKLKRVCATKMKRKVKHFHTTPSFGAVNYVGYENTSQPREYIIPPCFTDGMKQETVVNAFYETPTLKKHHMREGAPLPRIPRPPTRSIAGSSARRAPVIQEATLESKRISKSARVTNMNSLRNHHMNSHLPMGISDLPMGSSNSLKPWGTAYKESHNGRQNDRPTTAPVKHHRTSI